MQTRLAKLIVLSLCGTVLLGGACSAAAHRPSVGFLPFQGPRGAYTHVISDLIHWQMSYIGGTDLASANLIAHTMQLDQLIMPKGLNDTAAYSRLAAATGVDYLVTGEVESQDRSRVRFRVVIFSADDDHFHDEAVHDCPLLSAVDESVLAAKHTASVMRIPLRNSISFDRHKVPSEVLRLLEKSMRLDSDFVIDAANEVRARRAADDACSKCSASPFVTEWSLSYCDSSFSKLDKYAKLIRRGLGNVIILKILTDGYYYAGSPRQGRVYALKWLKLDPTSAAAQIAVSGRYSDAGSTSWRTELSIAEMYGAVHNLQELRSRIKILEARHSRSAYLRYSAWRMLGWAQEWGSAHVEIRQAAWLNPRSCELQRRLVDGYLSEYDTDAALTAMRSVLKRWPNRSDCHALAARVYRAREEYAKAAAEYRIAENLDPDAYVDHKFLAKQDIRAGNVAGALRELAVGDSNARRGAVFFSLSLVCVFLAGVLVVAVLIRSALRPERKPNA